MGRRSLLPFAALLLLAPVPGPAATNAEPPPTADVVVARELAGVEGARGQAEVLTRILWFQPRRSDDERAAARRRLVGCGHEAVPVLRRLIDRVDPEEQGELARAVIDAKWHQDGGIPPDYLPALEELIWFGSREARRLAIPEVARYRYSPALLPAIDAAVEDPELELVTVKALGVFRDDRARFYLGRLLREGRPEAREAAAETLAGLGGRALEPLRQALRDERRAVREAAARALILAATPDDLPALYEYYGDHPGDDAETREAVRNATVRLEMLLERQQAGPAAPPAPRE